MEEEEKTGWKTGISHGSRKKIGKTMKKGKEGRRKIETEMGKPHWGTEGKTRWRKKRGEKIRRRTGGKRFESKTGKNSG